MENQSMGMSITSMVLGICALVFSCCIPVVPFFLAVISLILGIVSIKTGKGGKGMAIAGVVCSVISLIPAIIVVVGGTALFGASMLPSL